VLYNTFDPDPLPGDRPGSRAALGVADSDRLFLQPTRALPRKNVAGGLKLAEALQATFWLLGPAEDGYGPELEALIANAHCPVRRGPPTPGLTIADAYAACDVVVLPSTWEGFGNPSIESATYGRPLAIGPYPVAAELAAFGFQWFPSDDAAPLGAWLARPDDSLITHNRAVAARSFNMADLPTRLHEVIGRLPASFA
jgi:glycosyltransferase involved in cell wall biosynthesis